MNAILLPVKAFRRAKTRHSDWLDEPGRVRLARAMLRDVAAAVSGCGVETFLVSGDAWALDFAQRRGWRTLVEAEQRSESDSVDWGAARLAAEGFTHALRVPADIPLVRTCDLEGLLFPAVETPGGVIVPSRDGTGTNALLRSPPDLFPSRFGPGSFALHHAEARSRGVVLKVVENPRIALDLDDRRDLDLFEEGAGAAHTRQALRDLLRRARR